ncbi:hypothetical protein HK101_002349 [Irineochytrium annulatum]|nr:hypothetical protein HK101_002349 [Irineochytrium annulatum]
MSIQQYGKKFPILLRTPSPRGQVELLETIGKGNYGYVYKVSCRLMIEGSRIPLADYDVGRLISSAEMTAVKVVFLKEDELKETLLEMEILKACSHQNVTRFMGLFLKGLDLWICMELCGGGALDSIYRAIKKPLNEDQIGSIIYESVVGLDYLHTQVALIHRDIKAGNLLLTEDGQLKIADFGVSAKLNSTSGRARTFIGTPYWMAPEVIRCDPDSSSSASASYDTKADVWSIGITAIEIADKNPPLSEIHPMRALHLIPDSNELMLSKPKNWSKQFVDFISICLIKDPAKRPTCAQLLQHPFMVKAQGLNRQKIMQELVEKAKKAREAKKAGIDLEDEDEEEKTAEIKPQDVVVTMKKRNEIAAAAPPTIPAPQAAEQIAAAVQAEFPNFVMEGDASLRVFTPAPVGGIMRFPVTAGDLLDGRYVLIGADRGLFFYDLMKPMMEPIPLLRNTPFKQIEIVADYGVMIALSGKHNHIRQYKLASIRKLILYLMGVAPAAKLARTNLNGPIENSGEDSPSIPDDDMYKGLHDTVEDEAVLVAKWSSDYIKIPNTKDSRSFLVQRTETSIFMGVLFKQDVILFEWAREPYLKFMKLKAFWLPEQPKFMNLLHDGLVIREVYMAYAREANLVNVDDSKVREVDVHSEFARKSGGGRGARWQTFAQIPLSDAKRKELRTLSRPSTTINRKLAAVTGPGGNAVASTRVDRYFLATYHRLTRVVDIQSQPMMGSGVGGWKDGVTWLEPPNDFVLRPIDNVIAIGNHTIEVADWKSAAIKQVLKIDSGATLKCVSSREGSCLILVERKRGCLIYHMQEVVKEKPLLDPPMRNALHEQQSTGTSSSDANTLPEYVKQGSEAGSISQQMGNLSVHDEQHPPKSPAGHHPPHHQQYGAPPPPQGYQGGPPARPPASPVNQGPPSGQGGSVYGRPAAPPTQQSQQYYEQPHASQPQPYQDPRYQQYYQQQQQQQQQAYQSQQYYGGQPAPRPTASYAPAAVTSQDQHRYSVASSQSGGDYGARSPPQSPAGAAGGYAPQAYYGAPPPQQPQAGYYGQSGGPPQQQRYAGPPPGPRPGAPPPGGQYRPGPPPGGYGAPPPGQYRPAGAPPAGYAAPPPGQAYGVPGQYGAYPAGYQAPFSSCLGY